MRLEPAGQCFHLCCAPHVEAHVEVLFSFLRISQHHSACTCIVWPVLLRSQGAEQRPPRVRTKRGTPAERARPSCSASSPGGLLLLLNNGSPSLDTLVLGLRPRKRHIIASRVRVSMRVVDSTCLDVEDCHQWQKNHFNGIGENKARRLTAFNTLNQKTWRVCTVVACRLSSSSFRWPPPVHAGWDKTSYGYHGDDGHSFSSSGTGKPYGPTFTQGDVVGCLLSLYDHTISYTKNGLYLGEAKGVRWHKGK